MSIRLDKWLWAARFYKTRSLASLAVKGGKVRVNGCRSKPSKCVEVGQIVRISKPYYYIEVEIIAISDKRGSYTVAKELYHETLESISKRENEMLTRKLEQRTNPTSKKRPSKRDRRKIIQFIKK